MFITLHNLQALDRTACCNLDFFFYSIENVFFLPEGGTRESVKGFSKITKYHPAGISSSNSLQI